VRKTFAGRTTEYAWDGNDLVHEITEGRETVTWEMEPGTFAPLAKIEGSKRYGVVTDHLGAPRLLVDEAGEVAWQAQLDVYGVPRQDVMRTACPWRWPGQYEDEETGLYYNRFRYYDPESGRYISQDPIGLAGGLEPYGYVGDPLAWIDPFGLVKERGLWVLTEALSDAAQVIKGNKYLRHASTGLWWSKDFAGHGGSSFKVFTEGAGNQLDWFRDADKYGDFISPEAKHKGPTGRKVCK
jgi:RHS repeat-associated protein